LTGQSTTSADSEFLRRALALAEGGRGRVSPNPLVGAVVVRGGEIIGEGFHAELGGLHAERAALADAAARGEDAAGATMYVTLEPCAHHGRQPPCSEAVIEARIARVVIASDDPTGKADGKGPRQIRGAGIEVEFIAGDGRSERDGPAGAGRARPGESDAAGEPPPDGTEIARAARLLNQPFRKHGASGRPWVLLKTAMSLDGRTATPPGTSPWISGPPARELVHVWRGECDAIAVGIGTVLADDPLLTARTPGSRQPTRVVFDSHVRLPLDSRLLATTDEAPVLVVIGPEAETERIAALREKGAETLVVGGDAPGDRVEAALVELGRLGLTSLMLEGGATLIAAFAAAGEIDEARVFVAPLILGGPAPGTPGLTASGRESSVPAPPSFRLDGAAGQPERVGEDTLIRTRFKEW
jgi:diaminohydroxyphosphoribosylaminopyrimidine deaminase/5-amino-6-(5-phosphoribosylamino)uracil reductase